jgi:hypothetical protein
MILSVFHFVRLLSRPRMFLLQLFITIHNVFLYVLRNISTLILRQWEYLPRPKYSLHFNVNMKTVGMVLTQSCKISTGIYYFSSWSGSDTLTLIRCKYSIYAIYSLLFCVRKSALNFILTHIYLFYSFNNH